MVRKLSEKAKSLSYLFLFLSWNRKRYFYVVYDGAVEIVVDSLRNDSPLMHFHLISVLNQYSSFVSLPQVFGAATALYVLVYYSVTSRNTC